MSAERLPEELATHWNEQNIAGGFEPLFGINLLLSATAIVLCALICGLAIARQAASALLARVGVGLGVFFALGVNAMHLKLIASQLDAPDPTRVTMNPALVASTLGLAALAGLFAFIFYRPQPAAWAHPTTGLLRRCAACGRTAPTLRRAWLRTSSAPRKGRRTSYSRQ